ncbi:MAG: sulfotransferase family protein, partial [Comamonadaceae bacterium]
MADASALEIAALLQQGNLVQAGYQLRALLQNEPDNPEGHRQMALLASRQGDLSAALEHMARAVVLLPARTDYRFQLGSLLAHSGQYESSLTHFESAVSVSPDFADAWYLMGLSLMRSGREREAAAALRRAWTLMPKDDRVLRALAELEFRSGYPADALPLWDELHRRHPDDITIILRKGETLSRLGMPDEAISVYSEGLQDSIDSEELWMALGQAEEDHGNRSGAEQAFNHALRLRPGWAFPLAGLLGLKRGDSAHDLLAQASTLLASSGLSDHDRALIGYEMGKAFDARGDHAQAMARWNDANSARIRMVGPFDPSTLLKKTDDILRAHPLRKVAANPHASMDDRLVFIVGMPRSGTTLTEQIIAAHPLAFGCGELPDIAMISRQLAPQPGDARPFENNCLSRQCTRDAIERYVEAVTRHAPEGSSRLVDKAPLNFLHLGLIAELFPRARVIWCRRDPRDIAISIYGENFALDEKYATSLHGIACYISMH